MKKRKMTIGVSGSIGAIALVNYVNILYEYYDIEVIVTQNAKNFIQITALKPFIKQCYCDEFVTLDALHIEIASNTNVMLLLPASANTISKMANGIADNLLTSTLLAYEKPVYIAANMNPKMWGNPAFQKNVMFLKEQGHIFINEKKVALEVSSGKKILSEACLPDTTSIYRYFCEELENE